MQLAITLPKSWPKMTLKQALEEYLLIPRKTRHILRTQKKLLVNGQALHWQEEIGPGDHLEFFFDPGDYPEKKLPAGDANQVDILYEDLYLVVVNKPEGMKTHANQPGEIALLNHVSTALGQTCYVVHRLDKETSGAIVFAKHPFVLPLLNRLLENRQISRRYWAVVQGDMKPREGWIHLPIGKDRHDQRKRRVSPQGQVAKTHYEIIRKLGPYSLVDCSLETGRTHQIRVHLSHQGHPIVGDPLYKGRPHSRLLLHAHHLSLMHPILFEQLEIDAPSTSFEQGIADMQEKKR